MSGLNDLVIGVQQVVLYNNNEFYLELGLGGTEGKYRIYNDTIFLDYYEKPSDWSDRILITENYFVTIDSAGELGRIRIKKTSSID